MDYYNNISLKLMASPATNFQNADAQNPRRSVSRDANFILQNPSLAVLASNDNAANTSVIHPNPFLSTHKLPDKAHKALSLLSSKESSRVRPPEWRNLSDLGEVLVYQATLPRLGRAYAFTLGVSNDNQDRAFKLCDHPKANVANWFLSRISNRFAAVGLPCHVWFAVERMNSGFLHLHGAFALPAALAANDNLEAAKRALRLAGGEYPERMRQYQVRLVADPDAGWATYAFKNWRYQMLDFRRKNPGHLKTVPGMNWIARSASLGRESAARYQQWRKAFIASMR